MLTGLDRVAWAELSHAYGSAEDVPSLLRALASPDEGERSEALDALYGNIWHQGTIYEATSHAVPFLIEIAGTPSLDDRAAVLELLYNIAHGSSYLDVHQHLSHGGQMLREQTDFEEQRARELDWVRRANEAIVDGHPRYLQLLDDRDGDVRRYAVMVLSICRSAAGDLVPLLIGRARTGDAALRASILYALAVLDAARARPLLEDGLTSTEPLVRLVSALGLSLFVKEAPPSAGEVLAHHLAHLDEVEYQLFPFGDDQAADIASGLTRSEPSARQRYAEILLESAQRGEAVLFSVVPPLMALAFEKPLENPSLDQLTPTQRRVLEFVAQNTWTKLQGNWSLFVNFIHHLRAYGLEELGEKVTGYST